MAQLRDLPAELIYHILLYLGTDPPPSSRLLHEEPTGDLFGPTAEPRCQPVASFSRTCRRYRNLSLDELFRFLKVDIRDCKRLSTFVRFEAFVLKHGLLGRVESLLIHMAGTNPSSDTTYEPVNYLIFLRDTVFNLLEYINPQSLVLALSPTVLECLLPYTLNLTALWAFDMQYHILRLQQPRPSRPRPSTCDPSRRNVLATCPWTIFTYNQGSSVKAYNVYEYWNYDTPSIFQSSDWGAMLSSSAWLRSMTIFEFIAVFPFSSHGLSHMLHVCDFISQMCALRTLRVQLAPTGNKKDQGLHELGELARNIGDLWQEFENNYRFLFNALRTAPQHLCELIVLDYALPGQRGMIDNTSRHLIEGDIVGWKGAGPGRWIRK